MGSRRIWEALRKVFPKFIKYYNHFELRGIENIPDKGSAIIAPNHSGAFDLDNFCLMSALEHLKTNNPKRKRIWLCYWDKWSIGNNPWAKWVQKFSPIPISLTGGGIPWRLVDKIVEKGELIAIMPEGHSASIKEGYLLWKFYPGVIKLHLRYQIPIIPTASIGFVSSIPFLSNQYNPSKVPPWEKEKALPFLFPGKLLFDFGTPISFNSCHGENISKEKMCELASIVRKEVSKLIGKYRKDVSSDHPLGKKIRNAYKKG